MGPAPAGPFTTPVHGLGASAILCRLLASLDAGALEGSDVPMLARRVARSMHELYATRAPRVGAGRRSSGAMLAENLLNEARSILATRPPDDPPVALVLDLIERSCAELRALRHHADAELARGLAPPPAGLSQGGPMRPRWSTIRAGLQWVDRSPIVPPIVPTQVPEDEPGEAPGNEPDDAEGVVDEGPAMPLAELQALADEINAAGDAEAEDPPLPPPAPSVTRRRGSLEQHRESTHLQLLEGHLKALGALYDIRRAGQAEDSGWSELERIEKLMLARADAITWLGSSTVDDLARAMLAAEDSPSAFAAALPLLCFDGIDAADTVLRCAERGEVGCIDGLADALRMTTHPEAVVRLPGLLDSEASPAARRVALRVLADHGAVDDVRLEALLSSPDAGLVSDTVAFILRSGKSYALRRLEFMAEREVADPAATELLVAATVLGSRRARDLLRARLRSGNVNERLLLTLAACGDESDVAILSEIALAGGPPSPTALRALGWLGSLHAQPVLDELIADSGFTEEAMEALTRIAGALSSAGRPAGRLVGGTPWTIRAPASLLQHEDTGSLWREQAFLELCARTGAHVPFDPTWPVARQRTAAATWQKTAEALHPSLASQVWLYRGQA